MTDEQLPAEVQRAVSVFLATVDAAAPGLVTGFYLVGSVALGDFRPTGVGRGQLGTASDIDFVAVLSRRTGADTAVLAGAHARLAAGQPRPSFDGCFLTVDELAAGPDGCPDVPCSQSGRFLPAGRFGINPVTFCELARHGIAVRGPAPVELDVWHDAAALRAFTADNLRSYWRPAWRRGRRPSPLWYAVGLTGWYPVWTVLGVSRLHYTLATGELTSKSGAGRYARTALGPRWHRIVDECLALRTGGAEGRRGYRNPLARRRETLAYLDAAIDSALAL
ncbi:aminoglycoside adenylyltransferase domain-containing protein [Actinocatenispora sera]|uniref:Adenylyltransferase AadA C-terminal domain-containing protein n=1 Tax=Actinocatenispora sera TaxID=390989 RepID=A0A810L8S2_9ACTN|nr:aminoglycoside adenylyltransferase domain-containing protein [Actinocatenispora sera]BCJ30488.1 hypothetical protein Asera_45960 [Actinocatenispora sera]